MKPSVYKRDERGRTALHRAAAQGHDDLVRSYLNQGADVMSPDQNGNSPLHYCGHVDTIRCLVDSGAELMARNKHGDTPLDLMRRRGIDKDAIQLMEDLVHSLAYDATEKPCLRSEHCLTGDVCCGQSIWSEFCSDVGLKRLVVILFVILCLSFCIAYKATGMAKEAEQRILVDQDVNHFEL